MVMTAGDTCRATPGCPGIIDEGYCNVCGRIATRPSRISAGSSRPTSSSTAGLPARSRPQGRATVRSRRTSTQSRIGAGLVTLPPMPTLDPRAALMSDPRVPEEKRFCGRCGAEVGRSRNGLLGRVRGFCTKCRTPFSFEPRLKSGDLVAGQYSIMGCIAYGGLGWIYLAEDRQVSNRWVVLKGILNSGDADAMAVAVAERQFLARVEHPNVVRIYNFVQHADAGYIVMEYAGAKTLNDLVRERRLENPGGVGALQLEHGIAYVLGILEDQDATIYGTDGYQAPEVDRLGQSVASDLYSIGRCLAMLVLDFRGYQTIHRFSLPTPEQLPLLTHHESLQRLLLKATAEQPEDRFQSADEMAEQLLGVLREVVAASAGTPRPGASSLFGPDLQPLVVKESIGIEAPDWRHLPTVRVNSADPAANFVVSVSAVSDPAQQLALLQTALEVGQIPASADAELALVRALISTGWLEEAERLLDELRTTDPWDWRATWYQGICLLARDSPADARKAFDRVLFDLPGELGPKLAEALAAELSGDLARAAQLYDVVSATDPGFTSACFGLARVRNAMGDRSGSVDAYRRIPRSSSLYTAAQVGLARALIRRRPSLEPGVAELTQASATIQGLALDRQLRSHLAMELLTTALSLLVSRAVHPDSRVEVHGCGLQEADLRRGLEQAYRDLARLATGREKVRLVDRANQVRPVTVV
jgi:serine/threonine-protein kinase PknG